MYVDWIQESVWVRGGGRIADRYRIDGVLGEGGSAVVLSATDQELERDVAIKLLRPEHAALDPRRRIWREANALYALQGRGAPRAFDVGSLPDGTPYLVLERLRGLDLGQLLTRHGPFSWPRASRYIADACAKLAEVHQLGIWHRDLKPSNLFLSSAGDGGVSLEILDFGLARFAEEDDGLSERGAVMGTPSYMPPEQFRDLSDADHRSDIWSLGVTLFELLTGALPFEESSLLLTAHAVLGRPPAPLSTAGFVIPIGLEQVVERCLAKDPAVRPQSALELLSALRPYACTRPLEPADVLPPPAPAFLRSLRTSSDDTTYGGMMQIDLAPRPPAVGTSHPASAHSLPSPRVSEAA